MIDETVTMEGRPVSPSIHPHMLFATRASWMECYDELNVKVCQARGIVGLLTAHEESEETPNNAIPQTAWMLDELLEAIATIADMMCDKLRQKNRGSLPADGNGA